MAYEHDMKGEGGRLEQPDGWHDFVITDCEETTSKNGNDMFVFTLVHKESGQPAQVYAIAEKGKRWFLKNILTACGVAAGADGIYSWDIPDVLNKTVSGKVVNKEETFIGRDNIEQTVMRSKVTDIKAKEEADRPY